MTLQLAEALTAASDGLYCTLEPKTETGISEHPLQIEGFLNRLSFEASSRTTPTL